MPSEAVSVVDHKGNATVVTVTLNEPTGGDRLIQQGDAIYTRNGVDGSARKQFTFVRHQRP